MVKQRKKAINDLHKKREKERKIYISCFRLLLNNLLVFEHEKQHTTIHTRETKDKKANENVIQFSFRTINWNDEDEVREWVLLL